MKSKREHDHSGHTTSPARGLNTVEGGVVLPEIATLFHLPCAHLEKVLGSAG